MENNSNTKPLSACSKPLLAVAFNSSEIIGNKPSSEDIIKVIRHLKGKTEISNSRLQLEFLKGYNWAYKIMDILENNQLVSGFDGKSQYRKVIVDDSIFDNEIIVLDMDEFL
ncbi:hypothetical protein DR871_016265 [Flavobacterium petrolei]|uniref:FtsK gamma domain-containing protein n=1 Tax=Flavobacterium petrolei TaxID=2259594 RepID=A0A482TGH9_9FLAO|nr:DNA translocase FtsK [Flavobacterium petrolei]RYJ50568.1 hypothetical protein DR871_016265 [Flavobacterium petrolei]